MLEINEVINIMELINRRYENQLTETKDKNFLRLVLSDVQTELWKLNNEKLDAKNETRKKECNCI